jgi:hypothetical protein
MRAEHAHWLPRLHHERLVGLERAERIDDGVEGLPAARRAARAAIHHEVVRPLGNLRIEIVHQHPERRFLRPPLAADRQATRSTNGSSTGRHRSH